MKLASLTYLPPPAFAGAGHYIRNLAKFKTRHPIVCFSEHDYGHDVIKIRASPEVSKGSSFPDGNFNPFAINNTCFFTGLRVARSQDITHLIYLEADCRVGCDYWDEQIFEEYFGAGRPLVGGGSLSTYNPANYSALAARRWAELVGQNVRRNVPIATYGWLGAGKKGPTFVFPNGALSVVDMAWMERLFNLDDALGIARSVTAWDMEIGRRLWDIFKEDVFDVLGHLDCIYSGYGDVLTSQEERLDMLKRGDVCAVHQIKGNVEI